MPGQDYIVIFGAAILASGKPSGSLSRRVEGALAWWRAHPEARFMPTGGVGRHGPAEAAMMRDLLVAAGVPDERIVVEAEGRDTLDSVYRCHALLRGLGDVGHVVCCTSRYHQPRCRLLFALLGYRVIVPPMPSDRRWLPLRKYLRFRAKEFVSTPYDIVQLLWRKYGIRPARESVMSRNLLIAGGVLLAGAIGLYLIVFGPWHKPDNHLAELADTAERVCLVNTSSDKSVTIHAKIEQIKGLSAETGTQARDEQLRVALKGLSDALAAEQQSETSQCMNQFVRDMMAYGHEK